MNEVKLPSDYHELQTAENTNGTLYPASGLLRRIRFEDQEYAQEIAWLDANRPKTRADCEDGLRPCPFQSCKYHLAIDVSPQTGSIKINFPEHELDEMTETCVLDIADRGEITLEEAGWMMNVSRERIRQLEEQGLKKIRLKKGVTVRSMREDMSSDQATFYPSKRKIIRMILPGEEGVYASDMIPIQPGAAPSQPAEPDFTEELITWGRFSPSDEFDLEGDEVSVAEDW